ncbi:hypothetical protein KAJ83_12875 [Marivibrio halodurans]|uniref:Uncharacterized protein n=1 Tax=Marivibrio halodurans TaxID=2039722 RepID=A0A8J7S0Z7_9PROT|nr:hypothetical protein [Marivibrio halodurans]MBP5857905.1 hypothetical protein [Marivibrio halodurans]
MSDTPEQRFEQWLQTATRYFVLINAGGAVAVLSFIGASLTCSLSPNIAVISLFFFVAGLVIAGIVILGQLTFSYRVYLMDDANPHGADISINSKPVTRFGNWVEPRTGSFLADSFFLFVLGASIGLLALISW